MLQKKTLKPPKPKLNLTQQPLKKMLLLHLQPVLDTTV